MPLLEKWGLNSYQSISGGSQRIRQDIAKAYYTIIGDKLYGNHYASAVLYDILIEYRRIAGNRLSAGEGGSFLPQSVNLKYRGSRRISFFSGKWRLLSERPKAG